MGSLHKRENIVTKSHKIKINSNNARLRLPLKQVTVPKLLFSFTLSKRIVIFTLSPTFTLMSLGIGILRVDQLLPILIETKIGILKAVIQRNQSISISLGQIVPQEQRNRRT